MFLFCFPLKVKYYQTLFWVKNPMKKAAFCQLKLSFEFMSRFVYCFFLNALVIIRDNYQLMHITCR